MKLRTFKNLTICLAVFGLLALTGCADRTNKSSGPTEDENKVEKYATLQSAWEQAIKALSEKGYEPDEIRLTRFNSDTLKDDGSRGWTFVVFTDEDSDWSDVSEYDISIHDGVVGQIRRLGPAFKLQAMHRKPNKQILKLNSADYIKTFNEKGGAELASFQNGRGKLPMTIDGSGELRPDNGGLSVFDKIEVKLTDRTKNEYFAAVFDPYSGNYANRMQVVGGQEQKLP